MKSLYLPGLTCTFCPDQGRHVVLEDGQPGIAPGDPVVCGSCGQPMVMTAELTTREMTFGEFMQVVPSSMKKQIFELRMKYLEQKE